MLGLYAAFHLTGTELYPFPSDGRNVTAGYSEKPIAAVQSCKNPRTYPIGRSCQTAVHFPRVGRATSSVACKCVSKSCLEAGAGAERNRGPRSRLRLGSHADLVHWQRPWSSRHRPGARPCSLASVVRCEPESCKSRQHDSTRISAHVAVHAITRFVLTRPFYLSSVIYV